MIATPDYQPLANAWSRYGRLLVIAVLAALVLSVVMWRTSGQGVDLAVVNQSGQPVDVSWQQAPLGQPMTVTYGDCESHSLDLGADASWQVMQNGEVLADSSRTAMPFLPPRLAIEIVLDPNRKVSVTEPRAVSQPVDVPMPSCTGDATD